MRRRAARATLLVATVACAGALPGCADRPVGPAVREGVPVDLGGLEYNVLVTRQINPSDPEDEDIYRGPPPPPGVSLYAVFIQVCNQGDKPETATHEIKVIDSQKTEFEPLELPEENAFAYHPERLEEEECIPNESSAAATTPTSGAVLLFPLPLTASENRPLELEIETPPDLLAGQHEHQSAEVELDL